MKRILLSSAMAFGMMTTIAMAETVNLTNSQMDEVRAGAITTTTTQLNGGGNTPQGTANGVPITTVSTNPTGKAPPGQN
jgi:hypothetical protein